MINLDRRRDRWEAISNHLDSLGIAYERIPAVDARLLAKQEEWEAETNGNPPLWRINLGSAANMRSHAAAMSRLLESDAPAALILEDDAQLSRETAMLLGPVDWWPDPVHVVRLEDGHRKPGLCGRPVGKTPNGRDLAPVARWIGGSAAYLIDRAGARIALRGFADPELTIDRTLFDMRYSRTAHLLRPAQIVPAMARQKDMASDIDPWHVRGRGLRRRSLGQILGDLPRKFRIHASVIAGQASPVDISFRDTVR